MTSKLTFLFFLFFVSVNAQVISEINFNVQEDSKIKITYYLSSFNEKLTYEIKAYVAQDGVNFKEIKAIYGDVGNIRGSGYKSIIWDVLKDYDDFNAEKCTFKITANAIKTAAEVLSNIFTGDEETKSMYNGYVFMGGGAILNFTNAKYKELKSSGKINSDLGYVGSARYVKLPFMFNFEFSGQTFKTTYNVIEETKINSLALNVSAALALFPITKYFIIYAGGGYQFSELFSDQEISANTSTPFYSGNLLFNITKAWAIGIEYKKSFNSDQNRDWEQISFNIGINLGSEKGVKK